MDLSISVYRVALVTCLHMKTAMCVIVGPGLKKEREKLHEMTNHRQFMEFLQ